MEKTTVSINIGGLANRIKCMVSCFRLSDEIYVKWDVLDTITKQIKHLLNCPYEELFSYPPEINEVKKDYITYKSHCLLIKDSDDIPEGFSIFKSNCKRQFSRNDSKYRNIDFEYNRIPENIKKTYIELFKKPILNKNIQDKIDNFYNKNMKDRVVISCHIRSWHTKYEQDRRSLFDVNNFINKLEELNKKYNNCIIFVTSDSESAKKTILDKFKNSISYNRTTNNKTSRHNKEGIKEDLIELYLLSRCNVLVGSHYSSYSEVAWWLSGCVNEVYIL